MDWPFVAFVVACLVVLTGFLVAGVLFLRALPYDENTCSVEVGSPGTEGHLLEWLYAEGRILGRCPTGGWRARVRSAYSPQAGISQRRGDELLAALVGRGLLVRRSRGDAGATFELPRSRPAFVEAGTSVLNDEPGPDGPRHGLRAPVP